MTLSHQMSNGFLIIFEQEATLNEDPQKEMSHLEKIGMTHFYKPI